MRDLEDFIVGGVPVPISTPRFLPRRGEQRAEMFGETSLGARLCEDIRLDTRDRHHRHASGEGSPCTHTVCPIDCVNWMFRLRSRIRENLKVIVVAIVLFMNTSGIAVPVVRVTWRMRPRVWGFTRMALGTCE